jgi:hypothetical protein
MDNLFKLLKKLPIIGVILGAMFILLIYFTNGISTGVTRNDLVYEQYINLRKEPSLDLDASSLGFLPKYGTLKILAYLEKNGQEWYQVKTDKLDKYDSKNNPDKITNGYVMQQYIKLDILTDIKFFVKRQISNITNTNTTVADWSASEIIIGVLFTIVSLILCFPNKSIKSSKGSYSA